MISPRWRHIRTKLTLWHMLMLGVILLIYSASASALLLRHLRTQLVRHAIQDLETVEGLFYFTSTGRLGFHEDYHNHPESREVLERLLEVRSPDGEVLFRNTLLGNRSLGDQILPQEGSGGYSPREKILADGTKVQIVSRRHLIAGQPTLIRVAYSEAPIWQHFREELMVLIIPLPFVLAIAGVAGSFLAKRALQPMQQMARRAEEITGDRLHSRLPINEADGELADLARVFNGMLGRLEQSFEQLRRFTSDASHELRTPLTAIRSVGEVGLRKEVTPAEYRDIIGSMLEESNRLTRLVDSLLTISRADAGQLVLQPSTFPAIHLVRDCASLFEVLLEERGQHFVVQGDETLQVYGDWLLLRQALLNVIHNAIKYSPNGGEIVVTLGHLGLDRISISIEDSGPGIPLQDQEKVFDRFYRVDGARSRETGGTGLGLSITKWAVESNGGSISTVNVEGAGCIFRIELPGQAKAIS
ncbi:sensor histidine kinase [Bryobacter aggregatus]|uniref:sensor histidine kinase n=1 Tax=Bryobacter aggregatus TaxID=360054 RepID=UPI0004E0FE1A|nr:ATP-binding protein [Bryobacter aggregatus]